MATLPFIAASGPVVAGYVVAVFGLIFAPGAVTALKGHGMWLFAGAIASPLVWWYAASFRSAKPGSWWADHIYGEEKRQRSFEEWGSDAAGAWTLPVGAAFVAFPLVTAATLVLLSR